MDKWSSFGKLPERMSRAAGAVWQGKLYLSGGYNGTDDRHAENSPRLWEFEPAKLTWRELEPMPTPRHGHRLVPFRGRLWAIGGFGGEDLHGVVESYDPVTNQWRKETSMPANRGFFGAGVVGGKLTVIGTIYGSPHPIQWTTKGWVETAAPDIPMQRFAAVVDGDGFLVFGGEPNGAPIQRFKP
jgi:N-acetylneuraminic acid mutarotase